MTIKEGTKIRNKAGRIVTVLAVLNTIPPCYLVDDENGKTLIIDVKLPEPPPAPPPLSINGHTELMFYKIRIDQLIAHIEKLIERFSNIA